MATAAATVQHSHPPVHQPRSRWTAPGWYRVAIAMPLGFALAFAIITLARVALHYHPVVDWTAIVTVSMISVPLAFLIGIGCFDYWFYWASGQPTRAEDHSGHGAMTWRDYFRVNTDPKVIGIQYICTTFFFFVCGGLMAMLMRAELAQPGTQFVDANTFNGLFSVHASLMIFLFIIPVFAGIANFVVPLMIGAPDMAFPRLNALSYWMLPMAGLLMLASFLAPGGAFATGWTSYAPLSTSHAGRQVVSYAAGALLRGAVDRPPARSGVFEGGGPVRWRCVGGHGPQLPGHDHHDAGTRDDLL